MKKDVFVAFKALLIFAVATGVAAATIGLTRSPHHHAKNTSVGADPALVQLAEEKVVATLSQNSAAVLSQEVVSSSTGPGATARVVLKVTYVAQGKQSSINIKVTFGNISQWAITAMEAA